jgi:hypothetical protein
VQASGTTLEQSRPNNHSEYRIFDPVKNHKYLYGLKDFRLHLSCISDHFRGRTAYMNIWQKTIVAGCMVLTTGSGTGP